MSREHQQHDAEDRALFDAIRCAHALCQAGEHDAARVVIGAVWGTGADDE